MGIRIDHDEQIRKFDTGATRDVDTNKYDYEAFLSPLVLKRYGAFMHHNRLQKDGSMRDGDNWQKGIPLTAYMKSLFRHFMDVWNHHRGHPELTGDDLETELCAVMFNSMGMLHEILKTRISNVTANNCVVDVEQLKKFETARLGRFL